MDKKTEHMCWTVKVGTRGQVVIPKELRDRLNIKTDDELIITLADKEELHIAPKKRIRNSIKGHNI